MVPGPPSLAALAYGAPNTYVHRGQSLWSTWDTHVEMWRDPGALPSRPRERTSSRQLKLTCGPPGNLASWTWFLPSSAEDPEHSALSSSSVTLDLARRIKRLDEWRGLPEWNCGPGKGETEHIFQKPDRGASQWVLLFLKGDQQSRYS